MMQQQMPNRGVDTLLDGVASRFRRHMVLAEAQADVLALFVASTYLYEVFAFTPYLHVFSPERECGKSTLLDVLEAVVCNPTKVDGISPAALFRLIEARRPTLLLDEMDTVFGKRGGQRDSSEMIRQVLNSGFQRGRTISRCHGDQHEVKEFATYCPKVIASIGELPETVASRSLPIRLERAAAAERAGLLRVRGDRIMGECAPLRDGLAAWAGANRETLADADPDVPSALGARQADICRPLFAIADAAGGNWLTRARAGVLACFAIAEAERPMSEGAQLLADVGDAFVYFGVEGRPATDLPSEQLLAHLRGLDDRPWGEHSFGRPMSLNQLASMLRPFRVAPKQIRIPGLGKTRGYPFAAVLAALRKYVPDSAAVRAAVEAHADQPRADERSTIEDASVRLHRDAARESTRTSPSVSTVSPVPAVPSVEQLATPRRFEDVDPARMIGEDVVWGDDAPDKAA
jgi:hypothetical protein